MNTTYENGIFTLEEEQEDYSTLPLKDKIDRSIEIIRLASDMSYEFYGQPIVVCYSGGKDSDVLLNLCEKALPLSKFEVLNSHTSVDAPETCYHIRDTINRINSGGVQQRYAIQETRTARLHQCGR